MADNKVRKIVNKVSKMTANFFDFFKVIKMSTNFYELFEESQMTTNFLNCTISVSSHLEAAIYALFKNMTNKE